MHSPFAALVGLAALAVGSALPVSAADAGPAAAPVAPVEAATAERMRSAASQDGWTPAELDRLASELLVDPLRFATEETFRARVVATVAGSLPPETPAALRDALLTRLSVAPGMSLFDLERIELSWGTAARSSRERWIERPLSPDEVALHQVETPIAASIFSLPGELVDMDSAYEFLAAVRQKAPSREILVIADGATTEALTSRAAELELRLIRTWGRSYSPWPRDPMSLMRSDRLGSVLALRPNRQATRELDSGMGPELIQELPEELDRRLGGLRWGIASVPFHNGNLLPTRDGLWASIHSLEPRILEILEIDRVPVERFAEPTAVAAYLKAADQAARELERFFGAQVELVHGLPETSHDARNVLEEMKRLGGGAGFDLDSLVTILSHLGGERPTALVGSVSGGRELLERVPDVELETLRATYGLSANGAALDLTLDAAQGLPRALGLEEYLNHVAHHLAAQGFAVRRLPLLLIPTSLLRTPDRYPDREFLVGWNNVVLEVDGQAGRAEGFSSGLAAGDAHARGVFAAAGYQLDLFPPLVESVLRNGGYRCASSHLRGLDPPTQPGS